MSFQGIRSAVVNGAACSIRYLGAAVVVGQLGPDFGALLLHLLFVYSTTLTLKIDCVDQRKSCYSVYYKCTV